MRFSIKRCLEIFLFSCLLLLVTAAAAVEQTGTLSGVVKDENGETLPGATISISSSNLMGGEKAAMSDTEGVFNFYNLPPGDYSIKVSMPGYITYILSDQRVSIGRTTFIGIPMKAGELKEEVTVTAETPLIDPKSNTSSSNFSEVVIQNIQIGAGARGYQNVFQQAAGVAGGSNPAVRGSTLGENIYLVDGVDTTDPVTSTFGLNFNFDAIEEVQLQTGGFTAEYGRATGGIGNIITKSGGNEFAGTFDIRYRTEDFIQKGKHYDPSETPTSFFNPAFTFGGPIVKDRLWFFLSYQYTDAETTPSESPVTYTYKGNNYIGKLTWMINSNNKVVFQITGDPADIDNANASAFIAAEAARFQKQGANFISLKYYSALSENWWLEAQAAYYKSVLDSYPQSGDFSTQGIVVENEGIIIDNYVDAQYSDRFRNQANIILTYFQRGLAGSHQFKFGVDMQDTKSTFNQFTPGGGYYSYYNFGGTRYPVFHWVDVPAGKFENPGTLFAGFIQDEWIINPHVTANIGFRYDSAKYENDVGKEILNTSLIQPRAGIAWDTKGDGTNVWKWSYGKYMHPNMLAFTDLLNSKANATELYYIESFWGDLNGDGDLDDEILGAVYGGPGGTIMDPKGIDPTYVIEYQVGYERRLTPKQGLKLTWVYKKTDDIIEDVYDEDAEVYVIKNLENGRRRYYGVEAVYNARIPKGEIIASYTYGVSKGNIEYTQSTGVDFDFPDLSVNRYGYLEDDRRNTVKVNGYHSLPLGFQIGWDAIYYTGQPYNTYEPGFFYGDAFVEPRGSRRLPNYYRLDLEGRKSFKIGRTNAQVILSIFNVLDDEIPIEVNEYYYSGSFGHFTDYLQPRRFEIGLRYQF